MLCEKCNIDIWSIDFPELKKMRGKNRSKLVVNIVNHNILMLEFFCSCSTTFTFVFYLLSMFMLLHQKVDLIIFFICWYEKILREWSFYMVWSTLTPFNWKYTKPVNFIFILRILNYHVTLCSFCIEMISVCLIRRTLLVEKVLLFIFINIFSH